MASLHTVQASGRSRDVTHSLSTRAPRPTDVRHLTTRRLGRVSPSSRPERYADDLDASRRPHCLSSSQTINTPASVTRGGAPGHTQSNEVERRSRSFERGRPTRPRDTTTARPPKGRFRRGREHTRTPSHSCAGWRPPPAHFQASDHPSAAPTNRQIATNADTRPV